MIQQELVYDADDKAIGQKTAQNHPNPKPARENDGGAMQLVAFDAFTDCVRSELLERRSAEVEDALGELHRASLPASTAILDNGATSLMMGHKTLQRYGRELEAAGVTGDMRVYPCDRPFRFGDGKVSTSTWCASLPVCFKGKRGTLLTYLVPGSTPILFPRPLLELFSVKVDFATKQVAWNGGEYEAASETNTGHYSVQLLEEVDQLLERNCSFCYEPTDMAKHADEARGNRPLWHELDEEMFAVTTDTTMRRS